MNLNQKITLKGELQERFRQIGHGRPSFPRLTARDADHYWTMLWGHSRPLVSVFCGRSYRDRKV